MLQTFNGRRRVLFVPQDWLNEVAAILNGLHSKSSTISFSGDGEESSGGGLSIDVNVEQAARSMRSALAAEFPCKGDHQLIGEGLKWTPAGLAIDQEWLKTKVTQAQSE